VTLPLSQKRQFITIYLVILPGPLRAALRQLGVGLQGGVVDPNYRELLAGISKVKNLTTLFGCTDSGW